MSKKVPTAGVITRSRSQSQSTIKGEANMTRTSPYAWKSLVLYRDALYPEGMECQVRSANTQALVFYLPPTASEPLDLVAALTRTFGSINGVDITPATKDSAIRVEITVSDAQVYNSIKSEGITFKGCYLSATVPAPINGYFCKIKYSHAPHAFKLADFQKVFKPYGHIVKIKKYYWEIEGDKINGGVGSSLLDLSPARNGRPQDHLSRMDFLCGPFMYRQLPQRIDYGAGCGITIKVINTSKSMSFASQLNNSSKQQKQQQAQPSVIYRKLLRIPRDQL